MISSPYKRAIQTIEPLAKRINMGIVMNENLKERILSQHHLDDWLDKLKQTFDDMELKFEGGESSQEATSRILEIIDQVFSRNTNHTIIVTHGNLLAMLLKYINPEFGFEDWKSLHNPDVFLLKKEAGLMTYERIDVNKP